MTPQPYPVYVLWCFAGAIFCMIFGETVRRLGWYGLAPQKRLARTWFFVGLAFVFAAICLMMSGCSTIEPYGNGIPILSGYDANPMTVDTSYHDLIYKGHRYGAFKCGGIDTLHIPRVSLTTLTSQDSVMIQDKAAWAGTVIRAVVPGYDFILYVRGNSADSLFVTTGFKPRAVINQ